MSDEIDIEEHDVLDNPTIKRIFPDLSVIKKEINQYYDEASNVLPQTTLEERITEASISDPQAQVHTHVLNGNDIITIACHSPETTETIKAPSHLHENIIILGSKPNTNERNVKKEPKIILGDINYSLNKSKRYCKECLILFPKVHLLKLHYYNVHSKNNNTITYMGRRISDKLYKCNVCEKCMSSSGNLVRHFKNLHGDVKSLNKVEPSNKSNASSDSSKKEETTGLSCFHCQELFLSQNSLIEHLYKVLKPGKISNSDKSIFLPSPNETNKEDKTNDPSIENECTNDLNESNLGYSDNNSERYTNKNRAACDSPPPVGRLTAFDIEEAEKRKSARNSNSFPISNTNDSTTEKTTKSHALTKQFNSRNKSVNHPKSHNKSNTKEVAKMKKTMKQIQLRKRLSRSMFYKCFICSKFSMSFKIHARHIMNDHKVKEVRKVKKEAFDSQCKFCFSKLTGVFSYNMHLYRYHRHIYKGVNNSQEHIEEHHSDVYKNDEDPKQKIQFALKCILFKCMECDLFFLSSNAAANHSKHVGHANTQKCEVCQRIFKKKDIALHKNQHSFKQSFTVHTMDEATLSRILYKCSNCTVHYSEDNFLLHFLKCDSETPDSLYCIVCDILINRDDMEFHGLNHKDKKMQSSDFLIIESDMIDNRLTSKDKTENICLREKEKRINNLGNNSKLIMHFCHTCKCFINTVNFTRKVHVEGRCGHMIKTICKDCGLLLTAKTHATHKQHHKKHKICLFDYLFYDLTTKDQICPPVPDYPKCTICGVHFLRNFAITIHSCQEQDYKTCSICSIKLTEHAYKLHMAFHNYSLQNVKTPLNETVLASNPGSDISKAEVNSGGTDASYSRDFNMIYYTCKGCHLTVDTYDKAVQHCQDHYDSREVQLNLQKCRNCNYMFQRSDYESHKTLHINGKYNKDSIKAIDYDPFYFRFNNIFWTKHIFAYVADEQIEQILSASIYRYECRLKMEEIQAGSSGLVLYKCDKCQLIIEPNFLYTHAEKSRIQFCVKLRRLYCAFCSLSFESATHRTKHEAEHESLDVSLKSYKIILFNKTDHEKFNNVVYNASNRYVLYQCRKCERVVDKFQRNTHICDGNNLKLCCTCGLLLHKQDFDSHFIRHEELDTFNVKNIIVVMFGKLDYLGKKERRSTYKGTIYDYTIYKCRKCDLCLSTKNCKSAHVCVYDNSKCKCSKCGLYFSEIDMISHSKLHETNVEYDDLNINIISFEISSKNLESDKKNVDDNKILKPVLEANEKNCVTVENTSGNSEKQETIYKCNCGLHFLEEQHAQKHANTCNVRMKISKQRCIKCDLLFTPGELFNHLLKHHCDKKLQFKFAITNVTKK